MGRSGKRAAYVRRCLLAAALALSATVCALDGGQVEDRWSDEAGNNYQGAPPQPITDTGNTTQTTVTRDPAQEAYDAAQKSFDEGDWDAAIAELNKLLRDNPNVEKYKDLLRRALAEKIRAEADAAYRRGRGHLETRDWDRAIIELQIVRQARPNDGAVLELLKSARNMKAAGGADRTGTAYLRSGNLGRAIRYFREASNRAPGDQAFAANLKRALDAQQRETRQMLDRLSMALSRPASSRSMPMKGPANSSGRLTLKGPENSSGRLTLKRGVTSSGKRSGRDPVEDLTITERHYVRITTPEDWPKKFDPVIELTNEGLARLQDGADWAANEAVDQMWLKVHEVAGGRIPGYRVCKSLKEMGDVLFQDLSDVMVGMLDSDMNAIRQGVRAGGDPDDRGGFSDAYGPQRHAEGKKRQRDILRTAGKSAQWGVEGKYSLGGK